jgi:hypothetical protein
VHDTSPAWYLQVYYRQSRKNVSVGGVNEQVAPTFDSGGVIQPNRFAASEVMGIGAAFSGFGIFLLFAPPIGTVFGGASLIIGLLLLLGGLIALLSMPSNAMPALNRAEKFTLRPSERRTDMWDLSVG